MSIYDGLDEMRTWIALGDWNGLEAEFQTRAARVAGDAADRIARVQLGGYEAELRVALALLGSHVPPETKAVYWEFDSDNDWQSAFFRCRSYQPEAVGDDEWASDFADSQVEAGPHAPRLAAEFARDWDRDDESSARNLYLVARTIAALGRASSDWPSSAPLCAGYHDQDVLFRMRGA